MPNPIDLWTKHSKTKLSQTKPQQNQTKHKISYNSVKSSPIEAYCTTQPEPQPELQITILG